MCENMFYAFIIERIYLFSDDLYSDITLILTTMAVVHGHKF
jgi:hypothetical protein